MKYHIKNGMSLIHIFKDNYIDYDIKQSNKINKTFVGHVEEKYFSLCYIKNER